MNWRSWDLNLKVRLIGETIFHTFFWMFFPFMALYFTDVFGKEWAGMLLTIPPLLGVFTSLIGGQLSDRFGRRPAMLFATALECAMFLLFTFSGSPWIDYFAFIGLTLASSIYWPASQAMVADLTPEEERRGVFAAFYTALNVGVVIGPVLGSIFFVHYRPQLMLACTLISLAYLIALFLLIRETVPESAKAANRAEKQTNLLLEQWKSYSLIFRDKTFALYIVSGILTATVYLQLDLYMGVYVKEYVPVQPLFSWGDWSFSIGGTEVFGWMVGLNGLLVVLFTMAVTRWFSHWRDRDLLILSSALYGLSFFAIGCTTHVWLLFGCVALFTFAELIRTPVVQSFVSKYAPEEMRGQYMGASTLQFSVGRFLAPLAIGLSHWLPPTGVFGVILLCSLTSVLIYAWMFRRLPPQFGEQPRKSHVAGGNNPECV